MVYDPTVEEAPLPPWSRLIYNNRFAEQSQIAQMLCLNQTTYDRENRMIRVIVSHSPLTYIEYTNPFSETIGITLFKHPPELESAPSEDRFETREGYCYARLEHVFAMKQEVMPMDCNLLDFRNKFRYVYKRILDLKSIHPRVNGAVRWFKDGDTSNTNEDNVEMIHVADALIWFGREESSYDGKLELVEDLRSDEAIKSFMDMNLEAIWFLCAIGENDSDMPILEAPNEEDMPFARSWFDNDHFSTVQEIKANFLRNNQWHE